MHETKVLSKSVFNAGQKMGLSVEEVSQIIGLDQSQHNRDIEAETPEGKRALILIHCYRNLYCLTGGNYNDMKHWMRTENKSTEGVPAIQMLHANGLDKILTYLSSLCER